MYGFIEYCCCHWDILLEKTVGFETRSNRNSSAGETLSFLKPAYAVVNFINIKICFNVAKNDESSALRVSVTDNVIRREWESVASAMEYALESSSLMEIYV